MGIYKDRDNFYYDKAKRQEQGGYRLIARKRVRLKFSKIRIMMTDG